MTNRPRTLWEKIRRVEPKDLTPHRQSAAGGASDSELAQLASNLGFSVQRDTDGKVVFIPKDLHVDEIQTIAMQISNINQNSFANTVNRNQRLSSYARMDSSGAEGSIVLDTYANETLNITDRTTEALTIEISDKDIADKVKSVLEANGVLRSAYQDIRSLCKYGDGVYAILARAGTTLVKLDESTLDGTKIEKPVRPEDIVLRWMEADQYELLGVGNRIYRCKLNSNSAQPNLLSGDPLLKDRELQPYEFALFSLQDRATFPYGMSRLERMRSTFESLKVVETLLAVTRANKMDRIAVKIPDTGAADPATALTKLSHMKNMLKTLVLGSAHSGYGANRVTRNQDIALTEWLFVPSNFEVQKLSTSLDFGSTEDAEYFRDKMITASGLPKGFFLADKTDTRPGTLRQQDVKFARSLIPVGEGYCEGLKRLVVLLAFYLGADISTLEVKVTIKKPAYISEDLLTLYKNALDAVDSYIELMKKIHGDDFKITPEILKNIVSKLDAPQDLFFGEDGADKLASRGALMDAAVSASTRYASLQEVIQL